MGDSLPTVWLIGGTVDSRTIAEELIAQGIACLVTVTTPEARHLYPLHPYLRVHVGALTPEEIPTFLELHGIAAIVDASHPFAAQITATATAIAKEKDIPYIRFERPPLPLGENTLEVPDVDSLTTGSYQPYLVGKRVLLTVGARWLDYFSALQTQAILFARILPYPQALTQAIAAGFTSDRIIALRPPVAEPLEKALWEQWQIQVVVTKASGAQGGELMKQRLAEALGITLIRIARPENKVGQTVNDLAPIYEFCQSLLRR
ncbi:precorrin-6A reductase [Synechocystis salina]|uniref:Precorrin-6A reductase n=1 Tax=Synechocystis salina LEGE 00031 TaxID=1828736 RepID=A0ABR9VPF1_9SYNC|nr:precorrin-6A reductase [Synechocystis salina]MBE9241547.1 precorrin-6A reductase [Synechocystis salina LEGE 00041]MBE9253231.1 precorrin-6A reductase [Synechocystis salina LEGE 00031]